VIKKGEGHGKVRPTEVRRNIEVAEWWAMALRCCCSPARSDVADMDRQVGRTT